MAEPDNSLMMTILKELRADMRQQRTLLLQVAEATHRHDRRFDEIERRFGDVERRFGDVERRISDTRAEIELMLKAELLGRLTHFETQMDERIAQLEDRLTRGERPQS
jgi:predicted  nucleic acid-binding Zn-ribbon protein